MKKHITIIATALILISTAAFAQEIHQSQVPSVVVNSFQKQLISSGN